MEVIMKAKLFLPICIFIFSCSSTLWSTEATFGPRRLVMLFDPKNIESPSSDSYALTNCLIANLEQKATPILLSESLWHNFVIRRKRYSELIVKDPFYKEFDVLYQNVQNLIKQYATPSDPMPPLLESALKNIPVNTPELQQGNPVRQRIETDFIYYKTHFDPSEWTVRYITDFAYLLVPNAYEQQVNKNNTTPITLQDLPAGKKLSERELILGLKIDKLQAVSEPLEIPLKTTYPHQMQTHTNMDLSTILVTRNDLGLWPLLSASAKDNEKNEKYLATWNIYLAGHGKADTAADDTLKLEYLSKNLDHGKKLLEEAQQKGMSQENIAILQEKIKQAKETLEKFQTHRAKEKGTAVIAGLEVSTFKKLLNFLNTTINTGTFFYSTCFGSGKNLEAPYQYEGIAKEFNYTIISGASIDAPTRAAGIALFLPPYPQYTTSLAYVTKVHHNSVELAMIFTQNFSAYFEKLEQYQKGTSPETLAAILLTIHPYEKTIKRHSATGISEQAVSQPYNIPLIRYPNAPWFRAINLKDKIFSITKQSIISHQVEGKPFKIQPNGYAILLLYTSYIPVAVIREGNAMPSMLSMIGGNAFHYFEKVDIKDVLLSDVNKGFIPIEKQAYTKGFFIKELICKMSEDAGTDYLELLSGKSVTLHDVIIINNDKRLFGQIFNPVNTMIFTYKDPRRGDLFFQDTWETSVTNISETLNFQPIIPKSKENAAKFTYLHELQKKASEPSQSHLEKLKGRQKVTSLLKEKAGSVTQQYRELKEKNPQGIDAWLVTLTPEERKIIEMIRSSEATEPKPTITKKEFETLQKTQRQEAPSGI